MVQRLILAIALTGFLTLGGCGEGTDRSPMNAPPSASGQDPKQDRGYSKEERDSFNAMPK